MDASHRNALVALTLLAALLRFGLLDLQGYWYDEAATVELMRESLPDLLGRIADRESTPPLYYVLALGWTKVFGAGEVGLRSLSALAGTAAVPVMYAAAKELASSRVGLAVAALATVNPLLVWYSQEARAYALLMLLGAASLYFFARLLRAPDRRLLALWAVASGLALATHYFAVFVVVPEALWLAMAAPRRRDTLVALAGLACLGLALLPLALHQQSMDLASFIRGTSLPYRVARMPKQLLLGYDSPVELVSTVLAAGIALAGALLAIPRLGGEAGLRAAAAVGVGAAGLAAALTLFGLDYFDTRNLIVVWLPVMVLVAAGLSSDRGGRAGAAGLTCLGLLGLASVIGVAAEPAWQREDWRGVSQALGKAAVPRAVVLSPSRGRLPFQLYRTDSRPLPAAGAAVREVALVSANPTRGSGSVHRERLPRPVSPTVPGFREVARDYADSYSLVVLRARRPVRVSSASLAPYGLLTDRPDVAVLLQQPGGG